MLATRYQCETPEGVVLEAELAGPVIRAQAYAIDFSIRMVAVIIISVAMSFSHKAGTGVVLIATFFLEWLYPVVFEVWRHGQTPGKKSLDIAVRQDNLTPVSLAGSLTRNLLRAADFLPFLYITGFVCALCNREFKRLGDIAAGTLVVHVERGLTPASAPAGTTGPAPQQAVAAVAPRVKLNIDEQLHLIEFFDRRHTISDARRRELAAILTPLVADKNGDVERQLLAIGAWLTGR